MEFLTNDAAYWYEIRGDNENAPVLMLLHGFTGSGKTWLPFIAEWEKRFRVLIVDLPGHGKTTTKTGRSMEAYCAELKQLCDHLGVTDVCPIGYSMGGRTALSFAFLYPELVSSLVLESASPGLATGEEQQARIDHDEKLAERIEKDGVPAFVDYWEDIPLFQTQKALSDRKQQAIRNERLDQTQHGLAQSLRFMGTGVQPSWWDELSNLRKPVLLLAGDQDEKFIRLHEKMAKCLPYAESTVVEDAGHAIHVEQPAFFDKIVTEFIDNR